MSVRNTQADELFILRAKAVQEKRRRERLLVEGEQPGDVRHDLLAWTKRYRAQLGPAKPFNLQNHLYLEAIYRDNSKEMVLCKAGQVGISEYLVSWGLWSADKRNCNVLYVFPNGGIVSDFSSARIGPALTPDISPYLSSIVSGGEVSGKTTDRVGLKRIRDRHIYLRGAQVKPDGSAAQLRSIDADCVILDEYDEMPVAAPALAMERLGHSQIANSRIASTPTYSTVGINKLYLAETDRRRWFIACEHCGHRQTLELIDLITEFDDLDRPVKWNTDSNGVPCLNCRVCHKSLNRLAKGEWVAEYPDRPKHGYHLSRLFMAHKPLIQIVEGLQSLDEQKRKETYNQGLGLPYKSRTSMSLSEETLDKCIRDYSTLKSKTDRVFMGVDVGSVLHVVIREVYPEYQLARYINTVPDFEQLDYLIKRYGVKICVIDALPETRLARAFQARFGQGQVWLCYYQEFKQTEPSETWNTKEWAVHADRTRTLDATMAGFLTASKGEVGKSLPPNVRAISDYYRHLTALERVMTKKADGNQAAVYIGDPDHYGHAENYCDIAMRSPFGAGWSRGRG